jgi:hypothetical protein
MIYKSYKIPLISIIHQKILIPFKFIWSIMVKIVKVTYYQLIPSNRDILSNN